MGKREESLKRWEIILGDVEKKDETHFIELNDEEELIKRALDLAYNKDNKDLGKDGGVNICNFVADINKIFSKDIVKVIENDVFNRKGLKEILKNKEVIENIEPNIKLASTILSLRGAILDETRECARVYINKVVEDINKKISKDIKEAIKGTLNRSIRSKRGTLKEIDYNYTIRKNIKNYNINLKKIILEEIYFNKRFSKENKLNIIIAIDQSGSMGESIIYSTVTGCILSKINSIETRVIAFDDNIIDLTEKYEDPVDMLFGIQLGGGTNINKAVAYGEKFIKEDKKNIFFIVSDLDEIGNANMLIERIKRLVDLGVRVVCLLAISDTNMAYYNREISKRISSLGVNVLAINPEKLGRLLEKVINDEKIEGL